MGVHGLWRLIEPSGKPVPLETLENKVLAIDISIWLHQAIKGFQDAKGGMLPNAHLLGIYHRLCKLLYYRIKPVFVFDGGVPVLKRETIAKRNQIKAKNQNDANSLQKQLLNSLIKHSAINAVLSEKARLALENEVSSSKPSADGDDMFEIPPSQLMVASSSEEETSDDDDHSHVTKQWDLHTIDEKSVQFKSLPTHIKHEILTDLKETRKQSSWGRIHELPTQSDDFAVYQMKRLLKRHSVQVSLEEVEKEMGGYTLSLEELEKLLSNHGVIDRAAIVGKRIASDENKRYVYIKSIKDAMEKRENDDKVETEVREIESPDSTIENKLYSINEDVEEEESNIDKKTRADVEYERDLETAIKLSLQAEDAQTNDEILAIPSKSKADDEYEEDLAEAIRLSLQNEASTSKETTSHNSFTFEEDENFLSDSSDDAADTDLANRVLASAKNYMTEYSGLPPAQILKIINGNSKISAKDSSKTDTVSAVIKKTAEPDKRINFKKLLTQKSNETRNPDDNSSLKPFETVPIDKNDLASNEVVSSKSSIDENEPTSNAVESLKQFETVPISANPTGDVPAPNEVELMTDSDSNDDFEEVVCKSDEKALEIKFEKVTELDDDLFGDVFADKDINNKNSDNSKSLEKAEQILRNPVVNTDDHTVMIESSKEALESRNEIDKEVEVIQEGSKVDEVSDKTDESELLRDILKTTDKNEKSVLTMEELKVIRNDVARETNQLMSDRSAKERLASNITEQMCLEAQELLQLFGVPYLIAPMEAEAQCAFLDEINLTDGTITDDSDIWLFGGKTVYKNFFNQSKYVMEFKAEDIQQSFKLSRHELILLALLVGSDYTTGLKGIGPVTAVEILSAFPPSKTDKMKFNYLELLSGLREFRRWFNNDGCFKNTKGTRRALRRKLKNIEIGEQFPSLQVIKAYLEPAVETSDEQFSWSKPDRENLIEFARQKFGWHQTKSEKILDPILKRLEEETGKQTKITNYFKIKHKIQRNLADDKMSKRVKTALVNKDKGDDADTDESTDAGKSKKGKNKISKGVNKTKKEKKTTVDEDVKVLIETKKLSRHKVKEMKIALNEMLLKAEREANAPSTSTVISNRVHRKETIPQKEKEKADSLKTKLKAVEIFRKSKQGPGYVKKRKKVVRVPKEDAGLSESSDS